MQIALHLAGLLWLCFTQKYVTLSWSQIFSSVTEFTLEQLDSLLQWRVTCCRVSALPPVTLGKKTFRRGTAEAVCTEVQLPVGTGEMAGFFFSERIYIDVWFLSWISFLLKSLVPSPSPLWKVSSECSCIAWAIWEGERLHLGIVYFFTHVGLPLIHFFNAGGFH